VTSLLRRAGGCTTICAISDGRGVKGELVYRSRIHITVKDVDGWNTLLDVNGEINAVAARLGLPQGTAWTLTVGIFNEIVIETDYASLAEFESAQTTMYRDQDVVAQIKRVNAVAVEGKGWSELLEQAAGVG
jgi:hypothetical protein